MLKFLCVACLWLVYSASVTAGARESAADIHPWEVYEFELTADRELGNPYVESLPEGGPGLVSVTFQGESGEAEGWQLNVTGFWDGGSRWRIRFAPPAPGAWSYRSSSLDSGLDGKSGRFRCTAWTDYKDWVLYVVRR